MSSHFDASGVWSEPVSGEIVAEHQRRVDGWMLWPSALSNAKLHAEQELDRLVAICNRIAWGEIPASLLKPSPADAAALLEQLSEEDRERLLQKSRKAAEQRDLLERIAEAEANYFVQMEAEQIAFAEEEARSHEWAEFEAFDAEGQQARFEAWRASRK
jgi:hypothetical protein